MKKRDEILLLFNKGLNNKDIYNRLKTKYNLKNIYCVSSTISRYIKPMKNKNFGKKNPSYKKINVSQLEKFVLNGKSRNEIKKIMNISKHLIDTRCKKLNIYEQLKINNMNKRPKLYYGKKGEEHHNYIKIPIKELDKIINKIQNNNLYTIKDIKYGHYIYRELKKINRNDIILKLKQNIRNYRIKNNPNYKDGRSKKQDDKIKKILLSQNYKCKICDCDISKKWHTHHLDEDHENNNDDNIVCLCSKHHNQIHQRGYNFHNKKWNIVVNEIFYSLQGEGLNAGRPVLFWRNAYCNLRCKFCDSKKSWIKGKQYELKDVVNELQKWKKETNVKHLVITGGESFYQNIEPLIMVAKCLDYYIEIETNGTIIPKVTGNILPNQFNISIKLANSGNDEKLRIKKDVIINYNIKNNCCFKFVISDKESLNEMNNIIKNNNINPNNIWLMPLTTWNKKRDLEIKQFVWNACCKYGFNYSPRLHVDVWGKKQKV